MPFALLLIGGLLALVAFAASRTVSASSPATAPASPNAPTVRELFERAGDIYGVDPDLLHAIAIVESNLNPNAVRWNPPRDVSVGLMQILCVPPAGMTREQAEAEDYLAQNKFDVKPWPLTFNQLKDAALNVQIGAQILEWNIRSYGFPRGVAIYNNWSARTAPVDGPFPNQEYVDKVLRNLSTLSGV